MTGVHEFRRNGDTLSDSPAQREAALRAELALIDDYMAALADPAFGPAGAAFLSAFRATGCTETADMQTGDANAYFIAFTQKADGSGFAFDNRIVYGPAALAGRGDLLSTRCHEALHAIQYSRAAALYAVPYNDAPVLLCPRDFVLLTQFTERDTFAKQAWLAALAADAYPDIAYHGLTAQAVERLAELYAFPVTKTQALALMGRNIMDCAVAESTGLCFYRQYAREALYKYEACLSLRADDIHAGRCTLARLAPRDLWEISGAFGPNLLGDAPPAAADALMRPQALEAPEEQLIAALNARLGIADDRALPSLEEGLRARGLTEQDLIRRSRATQAAATAPGTPRSGAGGPGLAFS